MDALLAKSEEVQRALDARERAREIALQRETQEIVAEARDRILEAVAEAAARRPVYCPPHRIVPYPNRPGCARCPYAPDHPVHVSGD